MLALVFVLGLAQRADGAMYFGATIGGETYGERENAPANKAAWDRFERHAGKKVAILSQGQGWCQFDSTRMDATAARGAIPLVTMGLGSSVTLAEVAAGRQDAAIRRWAQAAKEWGRPFLFGPWWEMNGNWYPWGQSEDFVAAWRHFHDVVEQQGASNVTWTWITNSIWYDPASDPSPYYPGNAYVDWAGIDSYNWGLGPAQPDRWRSPDETITPTLDVVDGLTHGEKPVVIAEDASSEYGGNKANWIREMLGDYLPHHPQIGAYVWFNWNPERNGIRYDWPIETSAPAQQAFREGIQSSVFVGGPQSPPPLTKVKPPPAGGGEPARDGDLSPPSELAAGPRMALAADGSATVVWSARDPAAPNGTFAVFARRLDPQGRPLGAPVRLSAPGEDALDPQVAVRPDGTATAVWTRSDGAYFLVQMRRIGPDGGLGGTVDLSQTGRDASSPDVAVAPDGTASIVWKRFDGSHYLIKERHVAADGTPTETSRTLSASGQDAVEPDVGIAGDDVATVVWSRFDGEDSIVQGRRVAPDGTPAASVLDLSASGQSAVEPRIAVAPGGGATVAWDRFSGSNWIVQAVQLGSGGTPAATLDLSAAGRDAAEPAVALDPDGGATVAWDRFDGGAFVVQARRITAAGAAGQVATLSATGRDAAGPQLDVAGDGTAAISWSRFDGSDWVVQARTVGEGGALGATANLSAGGRSAGDPTVLWRPDDALAFLWRRFDGLADVVQEPPPPPWPPEPAPAVAPRTSSAAASVTGGGGAAPRKAARGGKVTASLRIGKPRLNRRQGTARLPVTVSGPGRLLLAGEARAARELRRAGTSVLRVRARGAKWRTLKRRGTVRVRIRLTFVPVGAEPVSRTRSIRLRKRTAR